LIERTQKRVYSIVLRLVGRRQTAEDVVQETFQKVWKSWADFDPTNDELAWVLAIARNEVATHFRKVTAQKRGSPQSLGEYEPGDHRHKEPLELLIEAEDQLAEARKRTAILSAIERLSESDRTLISLQLAGLDYAEMADRTRRSVPAIGPALTRIRGRIREIVKSARLPQEQCARVSFPRNNSTNGAQQ
jgi:RNA polymerase sigma-70 factor (ECF subfamily)